MAARKPASPSSQPWFSRQCGRCGRGRRRWSAPGNRCRFRAGDRHEPWLAGCARRRRRSQNPYESDRRCHRTIGITVVGRCAAVGSRHPHWHRGVGRHHSVRKHFVGRGNIDDLGNHRSGRRGQIRAGKRDATVRHCHRSAVVPGDQPDRGRHEESRNPAPFGRQRTQQQSGAGVALGARPSARGNVGRNCRPSGHLSIRDRRDRHIGSAIHASGWSAPERVRAGCAQRFGRGSDETDPYAADRQDHRGRSERRCAG